MHPNNSTGWPQNGTAQMVNILDSAGNSSKTPPTTADLSMIHSQTELTVFVLLLYALIFLIGTFGNLMVLYVVVRYKAMQTITNKFIACLSISDLLICLFAIPFTPMNALMDSWIFGAFMCKLVPTILTTSVFLSTLISVVIAVDRYMVIVHPHVRRMTKQAQIAIIFGVWLLSTSAGMPVAIYTEQTTSESTGTKSCRENWPSTNSNHIYTWLILTLQLILPAVIITISYTAVSIKLRMRQRARLSSTFAQERQLMENQRNRRINKMLIAMVTIFIACWLPLDLFHFIVPFLPKESVISIFLIAHIMAMSSVMYNPFLYGWMNDNFNEHFCKIMPCLKRLAVRRSGRCNHSTTIVGRTADDEAVGSRNHLNNSDNPTNSYYTKEEESLIPPTLHKIPEEGDKTTAESTVTRLCLPANGSLVSDHSAS